ncbi:D-aspartate oxidase isoform X1 [Sitophilus oryzae]|uniref:D-aspartate oxidase isoform X1 n=1 Tax=Sitophilus oryzae TaxID=7048 RepID=A0A6J2XJN9_SITOR|nr:D-aspartate oxidase isoform X1 [Sitophilus oryzae]
MYNIAVIGGGCMGLASALEIQKLLKNNVQVTIFAEKFTPDTTSDIAAGLWEPYLLGETEPENLIRWGKGTYDYLTQLWQEGKAKEAGICLQPCINLNEEASEETPVWLPITLGYSKLTPGHLKSLNEQYKWNFNVGYSFITFTWEGAIFLPYLMKIFSENGGKTVQRRIEHFNELSNYDVIVNCTGLASRDLLNDLDVTPIRGQIRRVKAPWQYSSFLIDHKNEGSCYIIANTHSVVLGGTKQKSFDTTLSDADSDRFLNHLNRFIPSLKDAEVVKNVVGLRPYRSKVRLEEEFLKTPDGKTLKVVHNYGHGGSGLSLSVGCGQHAAELVVKMLRVDKNKL